MDTAVTALHVCRRHSPGNYSAKTGIGFAWAPGEGARTAENIGTVRAAGVEGAIGQGWLQSTGGMFEIIGEVHVVVIAKKNFLPIKRPQSATLCPRGAEGGFRGSGVVLGRYRASKPPGAALPVAVCPAQLRNKGQIRWKLKYVRRPAPMQALSTSCTAQVRCENHSCWGPST